ncbi:hypothetical protein DQ04_01571060 [Trypanosoma grayi]|uniref:hypothetical protein n=1 Tax=Trypanosoma grayi TaxID=71804 RepID=UPI0004F42734|nr:hypothetical protein DQ04_01571060 [Trypanosoma grayi]KEG12623.1 hypothetical protein DQ04_01571060 [Trypanosoma grayi]
MLQRGTEDMEHCVWRRIGFKDRQEFFFHLVEKAISVLHSCVVIIFSIRHFSSGTRGFIPLLSSPLWIHFEYTQSTTTRGRSGERKMWKEVSIYFDPSTLVRVWLQMGT